MTADGQEFASTSKSCQWGCGERWLFHITPSEDYFAHDITPLWLFLHTDWDNGNIYFRFTSLQLSHHRYRSATIGVKIVTFTNEMFFGLLSKWRHASAEYPSQLLVNSDAVTRAGNLCLHHSKSWNNDKNSYNKKITTCPRETRRERERELVVTYQIQEVVTGFSPATALVTKA